MRRRLACPLICVLAAWLLPFAADAAAPWKPTGLARHVVTANLKRIAPGFKPYLGRTTCSGQMTTAYCTVKASVSDDDVIAHVSFTRHRDGTHLKYVDKLVITAVMGGGTVTRTYYGNVYT